MATSCFMLDKASGLHSEVNLESAIESCKNKQNTVWINMLDPSTDDIESVASAFDLHPLTVEDLQKPKVRPKVEEFENYLFVVFKALNFNKDEDLLDTINLNFLLFDKMLITVHLKPLKSIKELTEEVTIKPLIFKKGPDFLFYSILDQVVDKYLPFLDNLIEEIDDVETRIFGKFDPLVNEDIFTLKSMIANLRRRVGPQREILSNLSGRQHSLINPNTQIYLRDVYDHIIRVHDNLESCRDIVQGELDSYMTQVSNRMNEVMKTLSIIATIMLPLGLLAGLFGTNFEVLPGAKGPYGFWIFSGILTILAVFGMIYFKLKKWF